MCFCLLLKAGGHAKAGQLPEGVRKEIKAYLLTSTAPCLVIVKLAKDLVPVTN